MFNWFKKSKTKDLVVQPEQEILIVNFQIVDHEKEIEVSRQLIELHLNNGTIENMVINGVSGYNYGVELNQYEIDLITGNGINYNNYGIPYYSRKNTETGYVKTHFDQNYIEVPNLLGKEGHFTFETPSGEKVSLRALLVDKIVYKEIVKTKRKVIDRKMEPIKLLENNNV